MVDQRFELETFIQQHRLPAAFESTARDYFAPLGDWLEAQLQAYGRPGFILGINGAQGTGKSTLSSFLAAWLRAMHGRCVAELSIDDIYLTRAEREQLARDVHPLLLTRGVPGSHDVALGTRTLTSLRSLVAGETLAVPRFDKAQDDRCPRESWPSVAGPVDLIIFEGWCVGSEAQEDSELLSAINVLEENEDADGRWRQYVNHALATTYPALFDLLDALVVIEAPDFEAIIRWRTEQEHKLRERVATTSSRVQSDDEIVRFVQHYERVTRNNFSTLPDRADVVLTLGGDHQVIGRRG